VKRATHSRVRTRTRCGLIVGFAILGLGACAAEVVRRPTELVPAGAGSAVTVEVLTDTLISVGPGYERVIRRGSAWKLVGRSREGDVYRPIDRVFTVEGAQVHEAYLVLNGDRIVGFYLPVERAFSPAPSGRDARLSIQRR
jgi:hypothetical protein